MNVWLIWKIEMDRNGWQEDRILLSIHSNRKSANTAEGKLPRPVEEEDYSWEYSIDRRKVEK